MKMTCEQFEALMHLYINNSLEINMKKWFEFHLITCPACQEKYKTFTNVVYDLKDAYVNLSAKENIITKAEDNIDTKISSYIDNELSQDESIKLKKMIINHPTLKNKIEKIYKLKKALKYSFDKTKLKNDYSKKIIKMSGLSKIYNVDKNIIYKFLSFIILCLIWIFMLISSLNT